MVANGVAILESNSSFSTPLFHVEGNENFTWIAKP